MNLWMWLNTLHGSLPPRVLTWLEPVNSKGEERRLGPSLGCRGSEYNVKSIGPNCTFQVHQSFRTATHCQKPCEQNYPDTKDIHWIHPRNLWHMYTLISHIVITLVTMFHWITAGQVNVLHLSLLLPQRIARLFRPEVDNKVHAFCV